MNGENSLPSGSPGSSIVSGTARLILCLIVLLVIVYGIAPLPPACFGPMRDFAAVVDETGITPGALYYTDIPQSTDAEMRHRDALRYGKSQKAYP
jgi:hypothetical protein